jgi:hypothetical protein
VGLRLRGNRIGPINRQKTAVFGGISPPAVDLNLDTRRFLRKNASELIVLSAMADGFYRPNALICDGIRFA